MKQIDLMTKLIESLERENQMLRDRMDEMFENQITFAELTKEVRKGIDELNGLNANSLKEIRNMYNHNKEGVNAIISQIERLSKKEDRSSFGSLLPASGWCVDTKSNHCEMESFKNFFAFNSGRDLNLNNRYYGLNENQEPTTWSKKPKVWMLDLDYWKQLANVKF